MTQKRVRFGIIGCGLMGREFASAIGRWCHLLAPAARPELSAICDTQPSMFEWYKSNFPSIRVATTSYRDLLASPDVDAVYCATPHNLHQEHYTAVIEAGKHLFGEKPFGIDMAANTAILDCARKHPGSFVRCSSEFPFYPAVQRIGDMLDSGAFGRIIEANNYFLHSSDMDPDKPINWKRMIEFNGEYGCMGDLGMHVCHFPFRAGWRPSSVRAILGDIVKSRPDGKGGKVPCRTWDNATLFCGAADQDTGDEFPLTLKTFRIAPGEKNTWSLEILGTRAAARFSTKNPRLLQFLDYKGGEQAWQHIDMGNETAFKTITGGIFEIGFSDMIIQMWAAYLHEMVNGKPLKRFAGCVTPAETALSHRLFTAALRSHRERAAVRVE
ncbi:MAG: Gfo/Idh/MocA family oxidoreductase [Lentisphaerae bacterium]|nr:Gfo/Idh/MocA family oxidoreductase [Lentisphaerota bacterium]